jgi:hypothetical protein
VRSRPFRLAIAAAILIGAVVRLNVVRWSEPWQPHHPDEHILPLEALASWEGIVPREVGWPGSTSRFVISVAAGSQMLLEEGRAMWSERSQPDRVLDTITTWIAKRYVEPESLYRLGRTVSVVTGILQVVAVAWALAQWVGPAGTLVGTLAIAISPLVVAYSQYVLADITGLLFATIAAGLAARPTPRRVLAMAALVGLAASSKFHFGMWVVTPLLCVWLGDRTVFPRKWLSTAAVLIVTAWVVVTCVPWFWINPLLALKEFGGVVLVKVSPGAPLGRIPSNASTVFGGFGILTWLGGIAGIFRLASNDGRRYIPIAVPVLIGTVALLLSATVFDRYGIVLLPGVVVFVGAGWDAALVSRRFSARRAALVALAVCVAATTVALVRSQRIVGETDVDVLARNWIVANVAPHSRVAIQDEMNAYMPRVAAQLRECAGRVETVGAYQEKWSIEGVTTSLADKREMESVILNDERFNAYWCRRELDLDRPDGFRVVTYHSEPRFGSVLEQDAVDDFRSGGREATGGVEVLVLNRPMDIGVPPAQVFRTARGQRVIYRR